MIFYRELANKDDAPYTLTATKSGWRITDNAEGETFDFDYSLIDFRPDVAQLGKTLMQGFYLWWLSETDESRSGKAHVLTRTNTLTVTGSNPNIATFWLGTDENPAQDIALKAPFYIEDDGGHELKQIDENALITETLAENIKDAKDFFQRLKAKKTLLRKVNELDSLTALEAQLDLLTRIVLADHPNEKLEQALDGVMVTDILSDEKLLDTISRQKKHLRNLQTEYFAKRGDCESGNPNS